MRIRRGWRQQYAPAHFSDYYAGVAITDNRRGLDVYRRPGSALDSRIQTLVHGLSITFHDARHSKAQLDQLATRVTADIPYWASQHVTITGVNPASIDGSAVQIEVTNPKKAQPALQNRYGPDSVRVVKTQQTKPQLANR